MESNSEIGPRTVIVGKDENNENIRKSVRFKDKSLFEIYNNFDFKDELGFSTFHSYIGPEFKKPHSPFDLCDWCEYGKALKKYIINSLGGLDHDYSSNLDFDSQHILDYYESPIRLKESEEMIVKIKEYQEVEFHHSIAKRQRNVYNQQRKDVQFLSENILIDFDFQQKLIVGIGPREVIYTLICPVIVQLLELIHSS